MKANKLIKFLQKVEEQIKPYGRTLKDVDVNFRRSDDSDIEQTDFVGVDLYDPESNQIIESVIIMGKH
tara:strand:+ start:657 stop:860 length:204 start_codon:yes stop_codon:yes gene_type:complete